MFIINFFEYTLSGWLYFIWLILMLIFSLACLGVVGDKVSKKRLKDLAEKRKKEAEEEYAKAHELVERQIQKAGVDIVYDPTAAGAKEVDDNYQIHLAPVSDDQTPPQGESTDTPQTTMNADANNGNTTPNNQDGQSETAQVQEPIPEVVDLDKVASSTTEATVSADNNVNSTDVNANTTAPVDNATPPPEDDSTQKEQIPAVLVINDDGTSNV